MANLQNAAVTGLERWCKTGHVLLTTSCTQATELAAVLSDIHSGDEVIMPTYTFVSTADAFVLRGAKVRFVDIRSDTMNIDDTFIEAAITEKTKAIVPMHYAGVGCEMDAVMEIANKYTWVEAGEEVVGKTIYFRFRCI